MAKEPSKKAVKTSSKTSTAKKAVAKKVAAKKTAVTKAPAKKTVAKKAPVKKAAPRKVAAKKTATKAASPKREPIVTTVIAKIDAGFGNELTIRGSSSGLVWEAGILMENVGTDEWVWRSTAVTSELEFKVLLNDEAWSTGPNGVVFPGATVVFEPGF